MKKWQVFLVGVFLIFGMSACSKNTSEESADTSWSKVEEAGQLTVATSGTLYPTSYYNDANELVGYDVDLAKEVANRLGVDIAFKEYNVDGQIASIQKGESDFAANDFGISTEDRAENFSLSSPIKYSFTSMVVRESDDSGIHSLEDLKGKKAAGEPNTSYMRMAEKLGAELVVYDNATNDQYLTDVANGRTDVIINDYYLQKMAVAALPDVPVKILEGVYFNLDHTGFLYVKDKVTLREKVDEVLADMQADGTIRDISEQYFQTDVSVKPEQEITETVTID